MPKKKTILRGKNGRTPATQTTNLIVAEMGEPERFRSAKQVGAYAGSTCRVRPSGGHCYRGSISRQGSTWLRWILVEAAMKIIRKDAALKNFYTRVARCFLPELRRLLEGEEVLHEPIEEAMAKIVAQPPAE